MRIVYLANSRIPSRAANTVQTMKMCNAFVRNGHQVQLYSRVGDEQVGDVFGFYGVSDAVRFDALSERGPRGLRTASRIARLVRRVATGPRPDLLFARDLLGLSALSWMGVPMVLEVHRSLKDRFERALFDRLWRRPSFVKLVVVSHGMRREYEQAFPDLPKDRIQVEPGAAEPPVPSPPVDPWPGRSGALQVGYVGHLYEGRGIDVVLDVAARLPAVDFHIVGGNESDIARWRARVTQPNALFHGFVPPSRLSAWYDRFDVLLSPYQREVFAAGGVETSAVMSPLKLFEYMSRARPIVCSDLPVLHEILTPEVDALLVPPADAAAWAGAVARLRDEPETRRRLGEAAERRFLERHTWTRRAARVLPGGG